MRFTFVLALAVIGLPVFAAAPAVPAASTAPVAAPPTAAAASAPAGDGVVHLPPENTGEAQLRAQLEQVRALNAQLRQEREQLEAQLATIQSEVMAEDKRLKQVVSESERLRQAEAAGNGVDTWLLVAAVVGAAVLLGVGFWYLRRRRHAVGNA